MIVDKSDLRGTDLEDVAPICSCGRAISGYSEDAVAVFTADTFYIGKTVVYCCDKCAGGHTDGTEQLWLYPEGSISKLV